MSYTGDKMAQDLIVVNVYSSIAQLLPDRQRRLSDLTASSGKFIKERGQSPGVAFIGVALASC